MRLERKSSRGGRFLMCMVCDMEKKMHVVAVLEGKITR